MYTETVMVRFVSFLLRLESYSDWPDPIMCVGDVGKNGPAGVGSLELCRWPVSLYNANRFRPTKHFIYRNHRIIYLTNVH